MMSMIMKGNKPYTRYITVSSETDLPDDADDGTVANVVERQTWPGGQVGTLETTYIFHMHTAREIVNGKPLGKWKYLGKSQSIDGGKF